MKTEVGGQKNSAFVMFRWLAAIGLLLSLVLLPWLLFEGATADLAARMLAGGPLPVAFAGTALLALDALLPVPSSLAATAIGALLGGPAGTLVNAAGLTLGCLLAYLAGVAGRPLARRLLGVQAVIFERWIARYGIWALILCRAVPVLAEASAIALGAGRARPGPLLAAALLADLSLGALYAFAGAAAGAGAMPGAFALAVATAVPAVAAIAVWLILRRSQKRGARRIG